MKINVQGNYNQYKNKVGESGLKPHQEFNLSAAKLDLNAISKGNTKVPDKQMLVMKSGVQSYVSAPADTYHLEGLKARIQSGAYRIDTKDIVNAMIDDNF